MGIFRGPSNRVELLNCNHSTYEQHNLMHERLLLRLSTPGLLGRAVAVLAALDSRCSEAN